MKYFYSILILLLVSINFSCAWTFIGHKKTMYKNSNGWFPNDFNPKENALLIPAPPKKFKERVDAVLKNFPVEYIITKNENDYLDLRKYRFVFRLKVWSSESRNSQTGTYSMSSYADYYFYDRLKNIDYPATGYYTSSSSSYSALYEILKYIKQRYSAPK